MMRSAPLAAHTHDSARKLLRIAMTATMPDVTHFRPQCDALHESQGQRVSKIEIRACPACGRDFAVTRPWQKQCTPRCRQRAYVQRKTVGAVGYFGA